ncbi:MAG: response regulator [Sphingobium sp.]|nr:response regulator [Sphingobium sp.]
MQSANKTSEALSDVVLLVEDEPLIAMTAEMMLEDLGVRNIRTAHNVAEAMAVLDETTVDLAILDYYLGRENSVAVAERLAKDGVRFAFASGAAPMDLPESCIGAPHVMKPYSLRELSKLLKS